MAFLFAMAITFALRPLPNRGGIPAFAILDHAKA